MNTQYEPSPDFVSRTMKKIHLYEVSKKSWLKPFNWYDLQRYMLALGWAVFGVLTATRAF